LAKVCILKLKNEFLKGIFAFGITRIMIALTNPIFNQDIIVVLLTFSFLLIALLRSSYWKHAKLLFMGVFAQRYANQYLREENAFTERVSFITFLLMSVNISVIILKLIPAISLLETFTLIAGVMLFFVAKIGLMLLLGNIFRLKDIAKLGVFFSFLFDRALGFFLFPLVVFLYFFSFDITPFIMGIVAVVFMSLLFLKLFWLWKIGTNSFGLSHFYIFLYLCTLEISPLLLLGKGVFY
jgi:hypothetical protein